MTASHTQKSRGDDSHVHRRDPPAREVARVRAVALAVESEVSPALDRTVSSLVSMLGCCDLCKTDRLFKHFRRA